MPELQENHFCMINTVRTERLVSFKTFLEAGGKGLRIEYMCNWYLLCIIAVDLLKYNTRLHSG